MKTHMSQHMKIPLKKRKKNLTDTVRSLVFMDRTNLKLYSHNYPQLKETSLEFSEYFIKNWQNIEKLWILHYRKDLVFLRQTRHE